ncbi:sulfite exporter TauE/SafE family protein [Marivita sp. GX14005]|uniref:sulfite exporter TauE/SafE family protein n=1 Tax=Marivita sp. GX14005 TaxID=2942276 RepID=UPI002018E594|nr:sulfite exporter TauE/SafE family protein [Marivita sp. GX14005]MCL3881571.1 sulfite exporter TauE/SafE family protein [Marivita sp. GX14005]
MLEILLLSVAAFGAGVLNTIAGGGTFLTFPALVLSGVPPISANATSTVAVFPGYLGGAAGYHEELRQMTRASLIRLTAVTLLGGLAGSLLLLVTSNEAFNVIVPFLLLFATLMFLFGPRLRRWAAERSAGIAPEGAVGLFLVSLYGGYFNGGLGIVLLALFALWGWQNIHLMNGLKTWLSFALSAISVATFAVAGIVAWKAALLMMAFSVLGGYAGARAAKAIPQNVVRAIVAIVGFGMSAVFFGRLF